MMRKISRASCSVSAAVGSSIIRRCGPARPAPARPRRCAARRPRAASPSVAGSMAPKPSGSSSAARPAAHRWRRPPSRSRGPARRQVAEEDVLGHRHVGHDGDFLRQQAHAGGHRLAGLAKTTRLARRCGDPAGIAPVEAGERSSSGSTCRPRCAEQRHHLAGLHDEVDAAAPARRRTTCRYPAAQGAAPMGARSGHGSTWLGREPRCISSEGMRFSKPLRSGDVRSAARCCSKAACGNYRRGP